MKHMSIIEELRNET